MENWKAWVKGLGDRIINPGMPLPASRIVTSGGAEDDNHPSAMMGFAVINAENMEVEATNEVSEK